VVATSCGILSDEKSVFDVKKRLTDAAVFDEKSALSSSNK
jgi:hypothetical protein